MITGIIYKIECLETGEIYYGSTKQTLNVRITKHKSQYKAWKKGKKNFITSFSIIDRDNYSFAVLETIECEDKKQLEVRECWYIRNNECVNKVIPTRTKIERDKKYRDSHKEQKKIYHIENINKIETYQKEYHQVNKDQLKEYHRQWYLKRKALKALNLV